MTWPHSRPFKIRPWDSEIRHLRAATTLIACSWRERPSTYCAGSSGAASGFAGAENWNMNSTVIGCPIAPMMEHIAACVRVCGEIMGNDDLPYGDFLGDVINPVALAEAIHAGVVISFPSCGLEVEPRANLGKLIRMPAAFS